MESRCSLNGPDQPFGVAAEAVFEGQLYVFNRGDFLTGNIFEDFPAC
jgi:hypothetical protein